MKNSMDFSVGTDFRERLLKKIKRECFAALDDDELEFVNAAGVPAVELGGMINMIAADTQIPEENSGEME